MKGLTKFYSTKGFYNWTETNFEHERVIKMFEEVGLILQNKKNLKVLDVGSGTGDFIHRVSRKYPSHTYIGTDIAQNVIRKNRKKKSQVKWVVADFNEKTSFKSSSFDLVTAGEILEHVYDTDGFIKELHRILKKGGTLILTTPNLASWPDRLFLLFGLQPPSTEVSNVSRNFGREIYYKVLSKGETESAGHLRCFTFGSLSSMLKYYRFSIRKHFGCSSHMVFINLFISKLFPRLSQNQLVVAVK